MRRHSPSLALGLAIVLCCGAYLRLTASTPIVSALLHAKNIVISLNAGLVRAVPPAPVAERILRASTNARTEISAETQSQPAVWTSKPDYHPGEFVVVYGSSWRANWPVDLVFHENLDAPNHPDVTLHTVADADGNLDTSRPETPDDDYEMELHDVGVQYTLTVRGFASDGSPAQAVTQFTDQASADIDSCANDDAPSGQQSACQSGNPNSSWQNGNLVAGQANYLEGDSVPFRLRIDGLTPSNVITHTVTIGWDTTQGGKHAFDYLTTYNQTVADANPCSGISGCGAPSTIPIPIDPSVARGPDGAPSTLDDITQIPGVFTLFGGQITGISSYTLAGSSQCSANDGTYTGNSTTCITITFTTSVTNPVLAWAGHISTRVNWGSGNSAIAIGGSPYHMRLLDVDGSGGNQDHQLQSAAVFFPIQLTITKETNPNLAPTQTFNYTTTGSFATNSSGPSTSNPSFALTPPNGTTSVSKTYYLLDTSSRSITEADPTLLDPPFNFTSLACTHTDGGLGTSTESISGRTVTIGSPKEGESITCTYINSARTGTIIIKKVTQPSATGQSFDFQASFTSDFSLIDGQSQVTGSLLPGNYTASEVNIPSGWELTDLSCQITSSTGPGTSTWNTSNSPQVSITLKADDTVRCTYTNTKKLGSLQIAKSFDPLASGFAGTFSIAYDCNDGTDHDGTVSLSAGGSQTISGIPVGTECTVTEPTLPAAPTGWTFGTPTFSDSQVPTTDGKVVITDKNTTYAVTVTNTIGRDAGSLRITKVFDPQTSGFNGTFAINYDCNDGTTHDGTANLAAGGETTISGIPTGTSCAVSEPTLPTAPTGWTFGTPTIVTSPQVITAKDTTYTVTVTNTISRDLGALKIKKVFDPQTSGFNGTFAINYDCNDGTTHDGTANLAAGGETTISGIPTGTSCAVSEPTLPTAPTGWTFGTPTIATSPQVITAKDTTYTVTVTNTISRDVGSLQIRKYFSPLTSGFAGTFTIAYNCDDGTAHDGTVSLAAGGSQTISGIPTGTSCTVNEPTLPTAPTGWTFGTPTLSDSQAPTTDGTVVITTKAATYTVSVTNSISRDVGTLKITKTVQGGGSGFTGTFSVDVTCTGDGGTYPDQVITYPTPGFVTIMGIPTGNQCTVTEDAPTGAPTGYSWGTASITGSPALIVKGGTTEVGVTNVVTARAKVVKTVNGQPPAAGQTFTFQLRTGASSSADGTVVEQKDTDASGNISFTTVLIPGQTYQICEWVMPAWNSNLTGDGPLFVPNSIIPPSLPNPNVNNMTVCTDFSVPAGQTRTFTVENTPPPGGRALTIGFWKNWASCTASAQKKYNFLDWALALASQQTSNPPGGMVISAQNAGVVGWPSYASLWYLVLKGDPTSTATNVKNAPGCEQARNLLDKTTIDGKKKMASDPLFNMTAQLVAAEANRFTGAGISGITITNINRAVLLDGKYGFNGLTYSPKLTAADTNLANCLATQLDNYNNDRPVSSCP